MAHVDSSAPPSCKGGRSHPGGSGWAGAATAPPPRLVCTPQPHLVHRARTSAIMNVSATVEDTRFVNRAYMLDLHTLKDGITLLDGTHIDLDKRIDKADGQQRAKDSATSSGAAHNGCTCEASIHKQPDLTACMQCRQRTLPTLVQTARVCAEVPGFETRIDLRGSCKASLVALVRKLESAAAAAKATRGALKSTLWFEAGDYRGQPGLFMHELAAARGGRQRCRHCGALHGARQLSPAEWSPPAARTADGALAELGGDRQVQGLGLRADPAGRHECGGDLAARWPPSARADVCATQDGGDGHAS